MMRVKIEDVCIKGSSNLRQSDVNEKNGTFPVFGAAGYLGSINVFHQSKAYVAVVKDGAGVGRAMLLPANSSIIGTMQYLLPKDNILPEYLYYVIKAKHLERYYSGATIPHIYFKDYKKEEFELFSFEKQNMIINKLKKVESLIANQKIELELIDELVKARFVELFGDENNSRCFDMSTVKNVAEVKVGVVIKPSKYYTDCQNGVKTFRSLNIGDGFIKENEWVYFTEEGNLANSKSILKENDVLVVRSGNPGTSCVVTKKYEGCNAIDVIIARPKLNKVNSLYLSMYTNMPHGKIQIKEGTGGAAQQHFNVAKYNALKLILPPLELQNQFADFVKEVDKSRFIIKSMIKEGLL